MSEISMKQVIFIDGCDYVGKTTLINDVENQYLEKGIKIKRLRFPSDELRKTISTKYGGDYHATPSQLYKEDVFNNIEKALASEYHIIICDRSLFTSVVYQEQDNRLESMWMAITIAMKIMKKANVHHLFVSENFETIVNRFRNSNKAEDSMDNLSLKDFRAKARSIKKSYESIAECLTIMNMPNVVISKTCNLKDWDKLDLPK